MTRAEEKAVEYQIKTHGPNVMGGASMLSEEEYMRFNMNLDFKNGYEQAEQDIIPAAQDLVDAVERYTRQECLRSELMIKKDKLKEVINGR